MFDPKVTREALCDIVRGMSKRDFARFLYCQHMAATFLAVGQFEHMLIRAMLFCDRVKIQKSLKNDLDAWSRSLLKQEILQGSTLGSLITILERHDVDSGDIAYLKWIKDKRDYFIHRLFHDGAWPGDLNFRDCQKMTRRLLAIQRWLAWGERRVWLIFERAGFVELDHTEDGGILAMNTGIYDILEEK